ncbi:Gfo/Idh/MocA family protein [Actinoplanes sp. RD1]|uniref:Gfo/Idh/MocA family protein n=1 Tax=Actinoplanes sp. RD1 TaxID=3064538 RepID=UPI0027418F1A|nr:Gfo/Idh/MocA family oxidoreductase [Actinoplanes sp. RD1]
MIRAAVVGCGDVSVVHLRAIANLPGAALAGVCDTDPARTAALPAPAFTDVDTLLRQVRPDVVHVCTPHDQHVPVALAALDAGVAVLLEKPVAHTVAEAEKLIDAARQTHLPVGICLQNRYNATSRAARELLRAGELGAVKGASATVLWHRDPAYYRARPWRGQRARSGGGVLINQAIHTLDLLEWILGDVERIRGHAGRYALDGIDVEDTASVILDHAGGVRSVLFATVAHAVDSPVTIEIVTERATLLIRGDLTVRHADGRVETVAEPAAAGGGRAYWGASHELLIADFYRSLAGSEPFGIGPAEGARSLRLIQQLTS